MSELPRPDAHPDDHPETVSRNARYGLILFTVYVIFYTGFVLLSALSPSTMAEPALGGVNIAIVYGFGLIAMALLLALVYVWLCRATPRDG